MYRKGSSWLFQNTKELVFAGFTACCFCHQIMDKLTPFLTSHDIKMFSHNNILYSFNSKYEQCCLNWPLNDNWAIYEIIAVKLCDPNCYFISMERYFHLVRMSFRKKMQRSNQLKDFKGQNHILHWGWTVGADEILLWRAVQICSCT